MKILQSLLYGLALAGPQQDDTEEMCGGVSRLKNRPKSPVLKNRPEAEFWKIDQNRSKSTKSIKIGQNT